MAATEGHRSPVSEINEEATYRRPLSRTSIGSRSHTPLLGQTSDAKLQRTTGREDTDNDDRSSGFLITEVFDKDNTENTEQHIELNPADWRTEGDEEAEDEDEDEEQDFGNTSNDGEDYVDITVDNGYDTDLEVDDEEFIAGPEQFDPSGIKDYIQECNRLGVIPCSYFERHVQDSHFRMKNHGLGPLGAKAIAKPLECNTAIETVDLEGNCIEANGARYFAKMLKENSYITDLLLSENNIGSIGAQAICEMLAENSTVRRLDLSGNNLCDADGAFFLKLLENNSTVRELHLSHNKFGESAAQAFKEALSVNESLRVLDLSWNQFRLKAACLLSDGIKENYGLKELYLSMNGFAKEGTKAMGQALKQNQCLERLDLSSNRITSEGALDIGRALQTNSDLKFLKIGGNPIAHTGALTLLTAISKNENTEMNFLHIAGVVVDDNFEDLHTKIMTSRPFTVIHGGVMSKKQRIKIKGGKGKRFDDQCFHFLMSKLRKYVEDCNFRMVDLFKNFDKDNSWAVDAKEFKEGIKQSGIDMTSDEIDFLAYRLDKDGDGSIDYGELVFADNKNREHIRRKGKMGKDATPEEEEDAESVASVDAILNALGEEDDEEEEES